MSPTIQPGSVRCLLMVPLKIRLSSSPFTNLPFLCLPHHLCDCCLCNLIIRRMGILYSKPGSYISCRQINIEHSPLAFWSCRPNSLNCLYCIQPGKRKPFLSCPDPEPSRSRGTNVQCYKIDIIGSFSCNSRKNIHRQLQRFLFPTVQFAIFSFDRIHNATDTPKNTAPDPHLPKCKVLPEMKCRPRYF